MKNGDNKIDWKTKKKYLLNKKKIKNLVNF